MRIALIASPFISVPPKRYGGTELFIAQLAEGLAQAGVDVTVYANGESTVKTKLRSLYPKDDWPPIPNDDCMAHFKDLNHASWAVSEARKTADIIHVNDATSLMFSRLPGPSWVSTLHHSQVKGLSTFYGNFPDAEFVYISNDQKSREPLLKRVRTIHHGIDLNQYPLRTKKEDYTCFLGRIIPAKGVHNAIKIAQQSGIPLKIAGEIQPIFQDYFDREVKPHLDGKLIEYVGEADLATKNELLGNSMAMLFPIEWDEPFGLVMIESMATGTPVIAFPRGSVIEVVKDGVSGFICSGVEDAVAKLQEIKAIDPATIRAYTQRYFSVERMTQDYLALYRGLLHNDSIRPKAY